MSPMMLPALDPTPLPAPAWLFQLLLTATFFVHVLFMNVAVGGSIIGAVHALLAREADAPGRALGRMALSLLSPAISFTITTGVAPLLFVQLLFAQTFYPATIVVGWVWLGLLGILIGGYYAVYLAKFEVGGARAVPGWMAATALSLAAIALIQALVNLLQLTPGRWHEVGLRLAAAVRDPTLLPRFLHFLLGALAVAGMFLAVLAAARHRRSPDPVYPWIAARGIRWALIATALQAAGGFWFLGALPTAVLRPLMRGPAEASTLALGTGLGLATLVLLFRVHDPVRQWPLVHGAAACMAATILAMIPLRDMVRSLYLAPVLRLHELPVKTQGGILALFLLLFAAGLLTVGWMMLRVYRERVPGR
ncbi:MAG: hypothetical protein WC713_05950 [Candidatus Methylomirabilota bacterium]